MPATITSTGRGGMKNIVQVPGEDVLTYQLQEEEGKLGGASSSAKQTNLKVFNASGSSPIVLRYISKSR